MVIDMRSKRKRDFLEMAYFSIHLVETFVDFCLPSLRNIYIYMDLLLLKAVAVEAAICAMMGFFFTTIRKIINKNINKYFVYLML